jgi:hypothetical protein
MKEDGICTETNQRWFRLYYVSRNINKYAKQLWVITLQKCNLLLSIWRSYTTAQLQAKAADLKSDLLPIPNVEIVIQLIQLPESWVTNVVK